MKENFLKLPVLTCKRCGYRWIPRGKSFPKECPRCKSVLWNKCKKKLSVVDAVVQSIKVQMEESAEACRKEYYEDEAKGGENE